MRKFEDKYGNVWDETKQRNAICYGWNLIIDEAGRAKIVTLDLSRFPTNGDAMAHVYDHGSLDDSSTYNTAYLMDEESVHFPDDDCKCEEEKKITIADEAVALVYGDRQNSYGTPTEDFTRTGKIWSAILGADVSPKQVALCMVGVKLSREVHKPKRDNLVDGIGYLLCAHRIETNT